MIENGADAVLANPQRLKNLGCVGVVTNQAAVNADFIPTLEIVRTALEKCEGSKLSCIFGPQHGYYQTEQANMIETGDTKFQFADGKSVPLFSLYSETRIPTKEQSNEVDTFLVDMQDVGCRIYTYMLTMAGCLKAAAEHKKKVVILDRVNPLGLMHQTNGKWKNVEGNVLDMQWKSFVGWYPLPMRHGLTMGELARYFMRYDGLKCDVEVIQVEGLTRDVTLDVCKAQPWVMPSPNLPTWDSAFMFPSFVALEGTNVCEGRGTTIPFQLLGAPYLDSQKIINFLKKETVYAKEATEKGWLNLREHHFKPSFSTFNNWAGKECNGIAWHVRQAEKLEPFKLGMEFLLACIACHPREFEWNAPGYEYNMKDPPVHLILGHQEWKNMFDRVRREGWSSAKRDEFYKFLSQTDNEAKTFADSVKDLFLY